MADLDFVSSSSICGQVLLRIVARGSAIVAELLRLSKAIPPVFVFEDDKNASKAQLQQQDLDAKYRAIIYDFRYFKNQELYDKKIDDSAELQDLDDEFRENNETILERFYLLFESIYKYISDLLKFLQDLKEGVFIQQTLEGVINNSDGRQLLAESLFMYGVILILMDTKIEGSVRERMLVSYYRYKGLSENLNIDEVCKLCRSTGFKCDWNAERPPNHPEDLFGRFSVPKNVVRMLLGRLRSEDIYSFTQYYPDPDHRSIALSTQAAMIWVLLFFSPDILNAESASMREIVDKHFPDNWVISYYIGLTVDLSIVWTPYKAAREALNNTITADNIRRLHAHFHETLQTSLVTMKDHLVDGVLTEDFVLENVGRLLADCREANVAIRWLILHLVPRNPVFRNLYLSVAPATEWARRQDDLLFLLLQVSQFEFTIKNIFEKLLKAKEQRWNSSKTDGVDRMNQLSQYFSGEQLLAKGEKHENLSQWFKGLSEKISSLDYHDRVLSGRKIHELKRALEGVESYSQIESNLFVKQYLYSSRECLSKMLRYVNVNDEVVVTLAQVSDIAYAWQEIVSYIPMMQDRIKRNPGSVIMFRSLFLKLASVLEVPLIRIIQSESPDSESVSQYYSSELVKFVRRVLEIIPQSMFDLLKQIIDLQTLSMKEIPHRLNRNDLREFAQLDDRYKLSLLTFQVGKFTEGMLAMETTLMGVVEVDPKRLLEDGIRKELVRQIFDAMDNNLYFVKGKPSAQPVNEVDEFEKRLGDLRERLIGMRRSFEYIQDYINMYGLKIWQEEFCRIVAYNIEQECNAFLKTKVYDFMSTFQSEIIPIPIPRPKPGDRSITFMGRLSREMMYQTDPCRTIYVYQKSGWYDPTGREVVGIRLFGLLREAVGIFGLAGLDRLLSFMIVSDLQQILTKYRREILNNKTVTSALSDQLQQLGLADTIVANSAKVYSQIVQVNLSLVNGLVDMLVRIGQAQLLRWHIGNELNFSSKLDSYNLRCGLETCNESVLRDIRAHYENPSQYPYPDADNPYLQDFVTYLETAGMTDPYTKIYVTSEPMEFIFFLVFTYTLLQLGKCQYDRVFDTLVSAARPRFAIDGYPFVAGVVTVLKQFHSSHFDRFLCLCGQYLRSIVVQLPPIQKDTKYIGFPPEVVNMIQFLILFCRLASIPRSRLEQFCPQYILDAHFL